MTDTFTWTINNLHRRLSDGLVENAKWSLTAKRGELVTSIGSIVDFQEPDPAKFIAYDELTEDVVIQWTKDTLTEEQIIIFKDELIHRLDSIDPSISGNGLPWIVAKSESTSKTDDNGFPRVIDGVRYETYEEYNQQEIDKSTPTPDYPRVAIP
tara:strand:- start:503 stop:964 length:462 start_codon:yes stop_codon:yes gene_type:complete